MRMARSGLSLVEVLVASLLLVIGLMPIGYGLAAGARLSRRAEARWRGALALSGRVAALQQLARKTTPRCDSLAGGSVREGPMLETWTVTDSAGARLVRLSVRIELPDGPLQDSISVRMVC